MKRVIRITLPGRPDTDVDAGTPVGALLPAIADNGLPIVGAIVNNDAVSLGFPLAAHATVTPLTAADHHGWRIIRWSLSFLLGKAIHTTFPDLSYRVRHSMSGGLFCTVAWPNGNSVADNVALIKAEMERLIDADTPISYDVVSYADALRLFESSHQHDKLALFTHRNPPYMTINRCGIFYDMAQEPIVHRAGLLRPYDLIPYENGMVLRLPSRANPQELGEWSPNPKLFAVYQEHISWGRILGVNSVGKLNRLIHDGGTDDLIQTAEALHEKKLAVIAADIANRKSPVKLILVAGPSSAGKTTFSKRLCTHLRVNGMRPLLISTDDYFVGDERNPRDANGHLDYEHIEAVDLKLLNEDFTRLLDGQTIKRRVFDFKTKEGYASDEEFNLKDNGVIVMEGIHSLNPRMITIPDSSCSYRIYVSALTQLGIDRNCRISTTDNRLIRRMVRDNAHRGHPALATLRRWPSVGRGEARWIFPFQNNADAIFNSALDYELAVLKPLATPLLNQVKSTDPEFVEARRLSGFLQNFVELPATAVPGYSILREYIGGSQLRY